MEGNSATFYEGHGDFTCMKTLIDLSEDLKAIYENEINCDLMLTVGHKAIKCHRAILSARSQWFDSQIDHWVADGKYIMKLDEDEQILDALLVYIYTGNLRLVESMEVPLFDLCRAAAQYGMDRFQKLLRTMVKSGVYAKLKQARQFLWKVNTNDCNSGICTFIFGCFSLNGTDKWSLKIMPLDGHQIKNGFCMYVTRKTLENPNIIHVVNLEMHILDSSGKRRKSFVNDDVFTGDGSIRMLEDKYVITLEECPDELLPGGILTLSGQLTVAGEDMNSPQRMLFQIKGNHEKAVTNELHALSYDMQKLLKSSKHTDTEINSTSFNLKVHSYILLGRSLIPDHKLNSFIKHCCSGSIVVRSFVDYLYTGQPRYLEDHMRQVYLSACKLHLPEAKGRYSRILANNLTELNVFNTLVEATMYGDFELVNSALSFIADNGLVDQQTWSLIAS